MYKLFLCSLILFAEVAIAEDEPGGWVEPGGYDAKAEEAKEAAAKSAEAKKKTELLKKKKAMVDEQYKSPEVIAKTNDDNICDQAGKEIRAGKYNFWQEEIKRRKLLIDRDAIIKKAVFIGSSDCTVFAALGRPKRLNRSVSANHIHKQFVYGRTYIYTQNGLVTSWQD